MEKRCSTCGAAYWSRWRNEPAALCAACRPTAILCASCSTMITAPADPLQQLLFPELVPRPPRRVDTPTLEERYWSLRAKASQAARRRYPYC